MKDQKRTLIYCFSGTGNSLRAAELLAESIPGTEIHPITKADPAEIVGGQGVRLGFVLPSYYGKLPRMVKTFLESIDIASGTYCFAVVTMGGLGNSTITALAEALRQKGCHLSYGASVLMAGNYIMRYNPDPLGKNRKSAGLVKKIRAFSEDIQREKSNRTKRFGIATDTLYQNVPALDEAFFATDRCNACGTCQKICPADNIEVKNGKPVWLHQCEHCTACINWCPKCAIEYGSKTAGRKRYHHPDIQMADICKLNADAF